MGYANLTDPNYRLKTDNSTGKVTGIISPKGDNASFALTLEQIERGAISPAGSDAAGNIYTSNGSLFNTNPNLPDYTDNYGFRHIGGGGGYPKGKMGGLSQILSGEVIPIYEDVQPGDPIIFGFSTVSQYTETGNLSGAIWQIGIEVFDGSGNIIADPAGGKISPAYFIPFNTPVTANMTPEDIPTTSTITAVFNSTVGVAQFVWYATSFIKAGSFIVRNLWAKNGANYGATNDMRFKLNVPKSYYIGNFLFLDANSTNYNNNTLALFTDGSITGMSDSVRNSQVNTLIDGSTLSNYGQFQENFAHIPTTYVLHYSNRVAVASIGNSRDQLGGSTDCLPFDQSYTFGITGKLVGEKYPVLNLSAFNDRFSYWFSNPTWNAVRRSCLQFATHVFLPDATNDINANPGNPLQLVSDYQNFWNIAELQGKGAFAATQMVVSPSSSINTSNFGTLSIGSVGDGAGTTRRVYNELIKSDPRYLKVYDVDLLTRSKNDFSRLKVPSNARAVVGSMAVLGAGGVANAPFTITAVSYSYTSGNYAFITFTVSEDPRLYITINDYVAVASVNPTGYNTQYLVSGITSTTITVISYRLTTPGAYVSGGTLLPLKSTITLDNGYSFTSDDLNMPIGSVNMGGSGSLAIRIIDKILSPSKATIRTQNSTVSFSGETMFIGAYYMSNFLGAYTGNIDQLHISRYTYQLLPCIGERGIMSPGNADNSFWKNRLLLT